MESAEKFLCRVLVLTLALTWVYRVLLAMVPHRAPRLATPLQLGGEQPVKHRQLGVEAAAPPGHSST